MEKSANFIPLGAVKGRLPFDQPEKPEKPPKVIGTTKGDSKAFGLESVQQVLISTTEERKRIAREIRLAARKEKKKIKSDAKKQRKHVTNRDEVTTEEPKAKRIKKSKDSSPADDKADQTSVAAGTDGSSKNKKQSKSTPAPSSDLHPTPEAIKKIVQKEKVRVKNAKKREEKIAKILEEAEKTQSKPKKRKRSKGQEENDRTEDAKPEKSRKKKTKVEEPAATPNEPTNGAEQWNPDALTGDEVRKAKFLRLLGAGKSDETMFSSKHKSQTNSASISKIQSELERQYEAGMKLKHGGSKRRGIGA